MSGAKSNILRHLIFSDYSPRLGETSEIKIASPHSCRADALFVFISMQVKGKLAFTK